MMKQILKMIFPDSDSPFILIEKRLDLLKFLAVTITLASGFLMMASITYFEKNNSIGHYVLVCQAAKVMPGNGVGGVEIVRTFPLDEWLGYGPGDDNQILVVKAAVNDESRFYAIAHNSNNVDLCLGELTSQYTPDILTLPVEYKGNMLIVGEIINVEESNPPIFVQTTYVVSKEDRISTSTIMNAVYGKEVVISGFEYGDNQSLAGIERMSIITDKAETGVGKYINESSGNSQVSSIKFRLVSVIINDKYFDK